MSETIPTIINIFYTIITLMAASYLWVVVPSLAVALLVMGILQTIGTLVLIHKQIKK